MKRNVFFTSDTHFSHENIIKYCNRPFSSVEEMNETIITNWNNVITPNDTVFHLGDFGFGSTGNLAEIKYRLNGNIEFVCGSHDKNAKKLFFPYRLMLEIKIEDHPIVLCHYAMRTWKASYHGSWHLFGHSHGRLAVDNHTLAYDVGVDSNYYTPVSMDKIVDIMSRKEFKPVG